MSSVAVRVGAEFDIENQRPLELSLPGVHANDSLDAQAADEDGVHCVGFLQAAARGGVSVSSGQRGVVNRAPPGAWPSCRRTQPV